jgi:hypothetical protein
VRAGDLDPADHPFVVQRPVQDRRGNDADIDDVETAVGQCTDEGIAKHGPARPIVTSNRHGSRQPALGEQCGI